MQSPNSLFIDEQRNDCCTDHPSCSTEEINSFPINFAADLVVENSDFATYLVMYSITTIKKGYAVPVSQDEAEKAGGTELKHYKVDYRAKVLQGGLQSQSRHQVELRYRSL